MKKIAYCVTPKNGGLFRFYLNLKKSIKNENYRVLAACIGPSSCQKWDSNFSDADCFAIAPDKNGPLKQAQAFSHWVEKEKIDILMPMDNAIAASTVRHLKPEVRLVTRCSSATNFSYRTCAICLERLQRIIVMSKRQREGFQQFKKLRQELVATIPHGVDLDSFNIGSSLQIQKNSPLRLSYVGRLDDKTKGVFWIPKILNHLVGMNIDYEFDFIGGGDDFDKLRAKIQKNNLMHKVKFHGDCKKQKLIELMKNIDILVFPSRVEGFPNALLEAMAMGVVPIASNIPGVTDTIIDHDGNGYLVRIGSTHDFAKRIAELSFNQEILQRMSLAAKECVHKKYSLERMGEDYHNLFKQVLNEPLPEVKKLPWNRFEIEPAFRPGWRKYVPRKIKNIGRRLVMLKSI